MSLGFDPSQEAAVSVALIALLHRRSPWEGTAGELRERLLDFITNAPPVRALERMLAALTPRLHRQGIDLCRIDSPVRRIWSLQLLHDPRSDLKRGRAGAVTYQLHPSRSELN